MRQPVVRKILLILWVWTLKILYSIKKYWVNKNVCLNIMFIWRIYFNYFVKKIYWHHCLTYNQTKGQHSHLPSFPIFFQVFLRCEKVFLLRNKKVFQKKKKNSGNTAKDPSLKEREGESDTDTDTDANTVIFIIFQVYCCALSAIVCVGQPQLMSITTMRRLSHCFVNADLISLLFIKLL